MSYRLELNNEAIWDDKAWEFCKENKSAYFSDDADYEDLKSKMNRGEKVPRIPKDKKDIQDFYFVIDTDADNRVGEVLVIKNIDTDEEELVIAIFEKHKRIARRVIQMYLDLNGHASKIWMNVQKTNPNTGHIKNMLVELGFKEILDGENLYRYIYWDDRSK